jgi:hypothetical protein
VQPPRNPPTIPPIGCGPYPVGITNATCEQGRWVYEDPCFFGCDTSGGSGAPTDSTAAPTDAAPPPKESVSITVPQSTVIQVSGNITAPSITLVIPVTTSSGATSGVVEILDCASIGGNLVINITSVQQGTSTLEVLRTRRPECFTDTLSGVVTVTTPTGANTADDGCSTVNARKETGSSLVGTKSIFVVLSLDSSLCTTPSTSGSASNLDASVGSGGVVPIAAGVAGAAVAVVVAAVVAIVVVKKYRERRMQSEMEEMKTRVRTDDIEKPTPAVTAPAPRATTSTFFTPDVDLSTPQYPPAYVADPLPATDVGYVMPSDDPMNMMQNGYTEETNYDAAADFTPFE